MLSSQRFHWLTIRIQFKLKTSRTTKDAMEQTNNGARELFEQHYDQYTNIHKECQIKGARNLARSFAQTPENIRMIPWGVCYWHESIIERSKNELTKQTADYHGFRRKDSITFIFSPAWSIALYFSVQKWFIWDFHDKQKENLCIQLAGREMAWKENG